MDKCDVCGKVSPEVTFNAAKGKHLCLSCKFGTGEFHTKKITRNDVQQSAAQPSPAARGASPGQPPQQSIQWQREKRVQTRVPVLITLEVSVGGVKSQIFYPANIQNFSKGGICIDWSHCSECTGYKEGDIHPFCIFSQFNARNAESKDLIIRLEIANVENGVEFKGKAVYTLKKGDKEYVGINFTHITPESLELLAKICKNL